MLTDGLRLIDGSVLSNAVVDHGTSYPSSPDTGELFFRTDLETLYVYNGTAWTASGSAGTFTITGDVTGTIDGGTDTLTLASVNANPGTYGSSTTIPRFTVDTKGRITGAQEVSYSVPASSLTGTTLPSSIVSSSLTSVGTLGSLTVTGNVTAADPTADTHLATKAYVDAVAGGLDPKDACYVATTANLSSLSGLLTVDGITLHAGDRVLVKNQTTGTQNGIYVAAVGAWARATDFDGSPTNEVTGGAYTFITHGTVNASTGWVLINDNPVTIGTTSLVFTQMTAAPVSVAGTALTGTTLASNIVSSSLTSVGTVTSGTWSATLGAVSGASLTSLNASNLGSGTVPTARLGSGTADSTTYLRGDNTWQTISTGAATLTSGQIGFGSGSNTLTGIADLKYEQHTDPSPNYWHAQALMLNGSSAYDQSFYLGNDLGGNGGNNNRVGLTFHGSASGSAYASTGDTTLNFAGVFRISASGGGAGGQPLPIVTVNSGTQTLTVTNLAGAGANITGLNASNLATGTVPTARLGTGTANSTTYLRGDGTWATIAGTGTVTSVAISGGTTGLTVSGSPITTNGTITLGGTLALASGGTGATTQAGAANAVLPTQTSQSGKFLTTDGSNVSWLAAAALGTANTFTATQTFNGSTNNPAVAFGAGYTETQVSTTTAATLAIDCSLGNNFTVTLSATAITAINFTNVPAAGRNYSATLFVSQDGTGSRSMSLSVVQVNGTAKTIKWANNTAPTLTTTASKTDIFTFVTYDGGNSWLGFVAGQNY